MSSTMTRGRGTVLHGHGATAIPGIGTHGVRRGTGRWDFMIPIGLGGHHGTGHGAGVHRGDLGGVTVGVTVGDLDGVRHGAVRAWLGIVRPHLQARHVLIVR